MSERVVVMLLANPVVLPLVKAQKWIAPAFSIVAALAAVALIAQRR